MTQESLWRKARICLAAGATITVLGASVLAPANAVDTSGVVAPQAVIQTVNETTDAQLSAESIVMNTVFSNDGGVKATIKYKVSSDNADTVKQIVEPKNGVGTMETSTDGGSTVYTVTIEGDTPQDFQQKFVKSDSTPNGYMPGAKFEFMIGEGFGLWPQYAFLIDAPFTSNWFKDGVTGEYTSTFDVPWLNSVNKSYKDSSTGQSYLQPSSAEVDGQKLTVSDPDGVTVSDAKPSEHIQFVASGPLRTQLIVFGAIILVVLLLLLGLIALLRKRSKKSKAADPATSVENPTHKSQPETQTYSYSPGIDTQPATRPNKIVPVAAPVEPYEATQPAEDQTTAFVTTGEESLEDTAVSEPESSSIDEETAVVSDEPAAYRASVSVSDFVSEQNSVSYDAPKTIVSDTDPYYDYETQEWKKTDGWAWSGEEWIKQPESTESQQADSENSETVEDQFETLGEAVPAEESVAEAETEESVSFVTSSTETFSTNSSSNEGLLVDNQSTVPDKTDQQVGTPTTVVSATEPYYDYEAQEWKNTDGWACDGNQRQNSDAPYYDYQSQQWANTDGWIWNGDEWIKQADYETVGQVNANDSEAVVSSYDAEQNLVAPAAEETQAPSISEPAESEANVSSNAGRENAASETVASATEPYYDYEAQQWKNTEGWAWDGNQWQKTDKPYYDFQAQQWVNTDGWGWDGDEWVKKPEYDHSAQKWTGTDGWKWDGADWRREPHYNHAEGAWKGTEGWIWTGEAWQLQ